MENIKTADWHDNEEFLDKLRKQRDEVFKKLEEQENECVENINKEVDKIINDLTVYLKDLDTYRAEIRHLVVKLNIEIDALREMHSADYATSAIKNRIY